MVELEFCWNGIICFALCVLMVSSHFCLWFTKMKLCVFFNTAHSKLQYSTSVIQTQVFVGLWKGSSRSYSSLLLFQYIYKTKTKPQLLISLHFGGRKGRVMQWVDLVLQLSACTASHSPPPTAGRGERRMSGSEKTHGSRERLISKCKKTHKTPQHKPTKTNKTQQQQQNPTQNQQKTQTKSNQADRTTEHLPPANISMPS